MSVPEQLVAVELNQQPPSEATWNPSTILDITLSNGNLTAAANSASNGGALGTTPKSSGKWMLTFDNVTMSDGLDYVGIGLSTNTLGLASGNQVQAILTQEGAEFSGTGSSALEYSSFTSLPANCTIDLCVDLTALLMWFRVNGGNWNGSPGADPGSNTGGNAMGAGPSFLPYTRLTSTSTSVTLNSNPASPPSGFSAWG